MPNTQQQHIEKGGGECPFCHGGDLVGESFDHYGSFVTQKVSCSCCSANWEDYYTLTRYKVLEEGEHNAQDS